MSAPLQLSHRILVCLSLQSSRLQQGSTARDQQTRGAAWAGGKGCKSNQVHGFQGVWCGEVHRKGSQLDNLRKQSLCDVMCCNCSSLVQRPSLLQRAHIPSRHMLEKTLGQARRPCLKTYYCHLQSLSLEVAKSSEESGLHKIPQLPFRQHHGQKSHRLSPSSFFPKAEVLLWPSSLTETAQRDAPLLLPCILLEAEQHAAPL